MKLTLAEYCFEKNSKVEVHWLQPERSNALIRYEPSVLSKKRPRNVDGLIILDEGFDELGIVNAE